MCCAKPLARKIAETIVSFQERNNSDRLLSTFIIPIQFIACKQIREVIFRKGGYTFKSIFGSYVVIITMYSELTEELRQVMSNLCE